MALLSLSQKIYIVKCYYIGGESIRFALDAIEEQFGIKSTNHNVKLISKIVTYFEKFGSILAPFQCSKMTTTLPIGSKSLPAVPQFTVQETEIAFEKSEIIDFADPLPLDYPAEEEMASAETSQTSEPLPTVTFEHVRGCDDSPDISHQQTDMDETTRTASPRSCNNTPITCKDCGKVSKNLKNHNAHKVVHSSAKPYKCSECPMAFTRSQGLVRHSRTHNGEKPYICKICGSSFTAYMTHQLHMRLHTGERPYQCPHPDCTERFIGKPALNVHLRINHGGHKETCSACGSLFKTSLALEVHIERQHNK